MNNSPFPQWDVPSLPPVFVPVSWHDVYAPYSPVERAEYVFRLTEFLPEEWLARHADAVALLLWTHPDMLALPISTGAAYLSSAYDIPRIDAGVTVPPHLHVALPVRSPSL